MPRRIILLFLAFSYSFTLVAAQRSRMQMLEAAASVLNNTYAAKERKGISKRPLQELKTERNLALIGYVDGPFAVVTDDELLPAVIGVSGHPTAGDNPNFCWWLEAMNAVADEVKATGKAPSRVLPSAKKHRAKVEPLLKTRWGQKAPFNNLCPVSPEGIRTVTGCVATSVAQVLNYHRFPVKGVGESTIYFPYQNTGGEAVTARFGDTFYDWDYMLDDYSGGYSEEEATAVATLMLHAAVLSDMQFGIESAGGSGTTSLKACDGLNRYIGFSETVRFAYRQYVEDDEWMDIIYSELSENRPLICGGQGPEGGHSFVFHGYNADGLVYINWGWGGDADGYYDVDLLNPKTHTFANEQDLIYHIKTSDFAIPTTEITLSEAGSLAQRIPDHIGEGLKLSGPMNGSDLKTLRGLLGCNELGVYTNSDITHVDLTDVRIEAGGDDYLTEGSKHFTITAADELPYKAFYNCRSLQHMVLPSALHSVGDGVWGNCIALNQVTDNVASGQNYLLEDGFIYSADRTELIAALPVSRENGYYEVPEGVVAIHPYAFAGYQELTSLVLPTSLARLGTSAFNSASSVVLIRFRGEELPTLEGKNTFSGIESTCAFYVKSGLKNVMARKAQWRDLSRVMEYGTTITAQSATREHGEENPEFGFTVTGDPVSGKPELVCEANKESAPGAYVIRCLRGTVEGEGVVFVDGTLYVTESTAIQTLLGESTSFDIFTLAGSLVRRQASSFDGLSAGVYIINGRKLVVK